MIALYAPTDLALGLQVPGQQVGVRQPAPRCAPSWAARPTQAGDRYRALSPLERVTAAAPRTLLAHGGRDQFVPHGHMGLLAARLRAMGVPCETLFIPYAQHAFDFVVGGFSDQILRGRAAEVPGAHKGELARAGAGTSGTSSAMRPLASP